VDLDRVRPSSLRRPAGGGGSQCICYLINPRGFAPNNTNFLTNHDPVQIPEQAKQSDEHEIEQQLAYV
jgi:hypothetical protein